MPSRRFWSVAVFCGAMGLVGGPAAHAQPSSSVRFVSLLLMNETKKIQANMKKQSMRDATIVKLNAATSQRQINQLNKTLTHLNDEILVSTLQLTAYSTQAYNYAVELSPPNSSLVSEALGALLTVQTLSIQAGLGIAPATPSQ
jgi:hypothetical protein